MRPRGQGFTDPEVVFTNKSTSVGFFHPLAGAMDAGLIKTVRVALELGAPGLVSVRIAYQVSDDGLTWPSSTTTPGLILVGTLAAATTEGVTYATIFEDISANLTKRYVRFGVWMLNASGTLLETAVVGVRIEPRAF